MFFTKEQERRMFEIQAFNVIHDIPLVAVAQEEMSEWLESTAKYSMGEADMGDILEESVDVMITMYNFITNHFRSDDIKNTINRKLTKCEKNLGIYDKYKEGLRWKK